MTTKPSTFCWEIVLRPFLLLSYDGTCFSTLRKCYLTNRLKKMFGKIESAGARNKRNRQKISKESKGSQNNHRNKKRRLPPSAEALGLSDQLKRLSREKKLDEALELFWDSSNNKIRDGHHACIMVDMAARCGRIAEGEMLLEKIAKEGTFISIETKTALLKVSQEKSCGRRCRFWHAFSRIFGWNLGPLSLRKDRESA